MLESSGVAAQLTISQEGINSMKLVSCVFISNLAEFDFVVIIRVVTVLHSLLFV
jgi:hypothetical protein